MFYIFDLNYLSIQIHASDQLTYNSVERSMATLSQKLADITLSIDKYGSYLNSQGQVINLKLAMKNFCYADKALYTLWKHNPIFRRSVITQYTNQKSSPFGDIIFFGSEKENTNKLAIP